MKLSKVFDNGVAKFKEKVLPYEKISKGILASEGFAFCALAEHFNVDLVIESGVCNGGSTEIWCRYFDRRTFLNVPPVTAIDINLMDETFNRLHQYKTILGLIEGNSTEIIPEMLSRITNGNIAVFIDGPKHHAGVDLAKMCLEFPQVKLVGVHDMCMIFNGNGLNSARISMQKSFDNTFFTDSPWYNILYSRFLDGPGGYAPLRKYVSFGRGYGPTVGLAWKGDKDEIINNL